MAQFYDVVVLKAGRHGPFVAGKEAGGIGPACVKAAIVRQPRLRKNPCSGNLGFVRHLGMPIMRLSRRPKRFPVPPARPSGERMDLAMAMALALFGMFAGSTALFFYRIAR